MTGPAAVEPPTAVLVVRAWRESEDRTAFRARVWSTRSVAEQSMQARMVASVEELEAVVTQWLAQVRQS